MRISKARNKAERIKSDLKIEFARQELTSYSGLELFKRYFRIIRLGEPHQASLSRTMR